MAFVICIIKIKMNLLFHTNAQLLLWLAILNQMVNNEALTCLYKMFPIEWETRKRKTLYENIFLLETLSSRKSNSKIYQVYFWINSEINNNWHAVILPAKINENGRIKFFLIFKEINFGHVYLKIESVDVYLLAKFLNLIFSETKRFVKKLKGLLLLLDNFSKSTKSN